MTKMKINEELKNYFKDKIQNVKSIDDLNIIEEYFFEEIEFDNDSYEIVSLMAVKKLTFKVGLC